MVAARAIAGFKCGSTFAIGPTILRCAEASAMGTDTLLPLASLKTNDFSPFERMGSKATFAACTEPARKQTQIVSVRAIFRIGNAPYRCKCRARQPFFPKKSKPFKGLRRFRFPFLILRP